MLKSLPILLVASAVWGAGWEVETIRIAPPPFARYTSGMTRAAAVAFLLKLGELASKRGFPAASGRPRFVWRVK